MGPNDGARDPADQLNAFQRMLLSWRLMQDPRVATWIKALVPTIAMIYVLSPIDLIPDFILGLGQIDDLSIIGIAMFATTRILPRFAPAAIVNEHVDSLLGRQQSTQSSRRTDDSVVDASYRVIRDEPAGTQTTR